MLAVAGLFLLFNELLLPSESLWSKPAIARISRLYVLPPDSSVASNFGSDVLIRPEDEDSPEFKEYLRQLLKMQMNRAKTGHAAPSSASSDAYFAKLTRLKIEKNTRLRLGLPDEPLDTSYKPEDYAAAIYEAQEPVVSTSGAQLVADPTRAMRAGSGNKVRGLTDEELRLSQAAENSVKKALEMQLSQELDSVNSSGSESKTLAMTNLNAPRPPPARSANGLLQSTDEEYNLIEDILNMSKAQKKTNTNTNANKNIKEVSVPTKVTTPVTTSSSSSSTKKPVNQQNTNQNSNSNRRVYVVPNKPASPVESVSAVNVVEEKKVEPVAIASPPVKTSANVVPVSVSSKKEVKDNNKEGKEEKLILKRPLTTDELEVVGKALRLTVKHRGGGPFGSGRLEGNEIRELETALLAASNLMERDSSDASPVKPTTAASSSANREEIVLPPIPKTSSSSSSSVVKKQQQQPTPSQPTQPQLKAPTPIQSPPPMKKQPSPPPPPRQPEESMSPVPISVGLDQFLQSPDQMSMEQLSALRDGLIQCLSLVQSQLANPNPNPNSNPMPIDRETRVVATSPIPSSNPSSNPIPAVINDGPGLNSLNTSELKTTLGMLLKHRGGPGFGHGRLTGRDLDILETRLRDLVVSLQMDILD